MSLLTRYYEVFTVSRYNEFYVKFELDDETILRFENDSDTHIFQVQIYRVFKILKIILSDSVMIMK